MAQSAVIAVSDLLFQSRVEAAARSLRMELRVATAADALHDALAASPKLLIIDLHERSLDALPAIAEASALGVAVLAFGRHTEPALLRAAREAGASRVVPRSQLAEQLPALLAELIGPAEANA